MRMKQKRGFRYIKETEISKSDEVVYFCPVSPKLDLSRWSKLTTNCDKYLEQIYRDKWKALFSREFFSISTKETSSNSTELFSVKS